MLYYIDNNAQLTFYSLLSCNVTIQHYEKYVRIGKVRVLLFRVLHLRRFFLFFSRFSLHFFFVLLRLEEKGPILQREKIHIIDERRYRAKNYKLERRNESVLVFFFFQCCDSHIRILFVTKTVVRSNERNRNKGGSLFSISFTFFYHFFFVFSCFFFWFRLTHSSGLRGSRNKGSGKRDSLLVSRVDAQIGVLYQRQFTNNTNVCKYRYYNNRFPLSEKEA